MVNDPLMRRSKHVLTSSTSHQRTTTRTEESREVCIGMSSLSMPASTPQATSPRVTGTALPAPTGGQSGFGNQGGPGSMADAQGARQTNVVGAQQFTIRTITGRHFLAGTNAKVFIKLIGVRESQDIALKDSLDKGNPFEAGQVDNFRASAPTGVLGSVYKIRLWHDNTGRFPGWLLNEVHIIPDDQKSYGRPVVFKCNRWIFKDGSKDSVVELELADFPFSSLDLMKEKNTTEHHTDKFQDIPENTLIVRRGQTFDLKIWTRRPVRDTDKFRLNLSTGKQPRAADKTLVDLEMIKMQEFEANAEKWMFAQYPQLTREIRTYQIYKVNIPGDALPAKYKMTVENDNGVLSEAEYTVIVLFNPWSSADDVYMEDTQLLEEYILRQKGCIYVGSGQAPSRKDWYFGQFEKCTLDAVFKVLEGIKAKDRDSPIEVARIMSAKVNANDDSGILVGNWTGDYAGGSKPTYWVSSTAIMSQYLTESKSVCYGQCWVFSACLTAMMRCIGIPCRSVTTFNSAHDTQGNLSIDVYVDEDGDEIKGAENSDSVWNFHVWNDVWMARPDLPVGFGGWQAIDATPQERSQGLMQMGPASLRAVKEGRIDLPFDTGFVMAEVNADKIYWQKNKAGEWEAIATNRDVIGLNISTKSPHSFSREDITDQYKFEEGSVMERAAVKRAMKTAGNIAVRAMRDEIDMKVEARADEIVIGEDLILHVTLTNSSSKDLVVSLTVGGQVVRYDGVPIVQLEKHKEKLTVKANGGPTIVIDAPDHDQENFYDELEDHPVFTGAAETSQDQELFYDQLEGNEIPIKIPASHYTSYLEDDTMIRFVAAASVETTNQVLMQDTLVNLKKPGLRLENLPAEFKVGVENEFTVTFINPLEVELTNCEMYVDGSLNNTRTFLKTKNVPARGKFSQSVKVLANSGAGKKSLMVSFSCKQMGGLYGTTVVQCGTPVRAPPR